MNRAEIAHAVDLKTCEAGDPCTAEKKCRIHRIATALHSFETQNLAGDLLLRLGLPDNLPEPAISTRRPKTRRLTSPSQVTRAIADVVTEMADGTIPPPAGRARLYGLQTLLVAMRMTRDLDAPAEQFGDAADPAAAELRHLHRHTAERSTPARQQKALAAACNIDGDPDRQQNSS